MKIQSSRTSLFERDDRMVTSEGKGHVFQETRPGAGFKTGDSVEENLGVLP